MVVSLTSIRLRKWWQFFQLSYFGMTIFRQLRRQPGCLRMKNTGFGYWHYTLSVWENEEAIKPFVRSGAHLHAMKFSRRLSHEIRTYTYRTDRIPSWKEAKQLLRERGKVIHYQ